MCGAKNFVSVRLYSAPQSHWTIVAILGICAYGLRDQAEFVAKIKQIQSAMGPRKPPGGVLTPGGFAMLGPDGGNIRFVDDSAFS